MQSNFTVVPNKPLQEFRHLVKTSPKRFSSPKKKESCAHLNATLSPFEASSAADGGDDNDDDEEEDVLLNDEVGSIYDEERRCTEDGFFTDDDDDSDNDVDDELKKQFVDEKTGDEAGKR
jgi:hypothetical protein